MTDARPRVGLTLPSFVADPDVLLRVAVAADQVGLDAVFAYEHLFRVARDGSRRPAQDCWATLGAVAAETRAVRLGPLVARSTLRPAAVLAHACATVARVSGDRMIAVLGAGDGESRAENEEFGLAFGTLDERVGALGDALDAVTATGVETWVGGTHPRVLALAARAQGWNRWAGDRDRFVADAARVRAANPDAVLTWGGLVVLAASDSEAATKAARLSASPGTFIGSPATVARSLLPCVEAGAAWIVLAPVDSSDPANAELAARVADELAR
jgi:alkanesulfonate monooxygenase SsuD/methylene tetrahydromethanopterin reductase-like flavin-dependent oxidoreductase (luciferase family)